MAGSGPLAQLRHDGLTVFRDGDRLHIAPRERLTDTLRATIRYRKRELLADLADEQPDPAAPLVDPAQARRRRQVIEALRSRPEIKYAYVAEHAPSGDGLIMIGIRGVGTGELRIPADQYDPLAVISNFNGEGQSVDN